MPERRLAAILAADVAGYSRLMEADEEGTHGFLKSILRELMEPSIAAHNGNLVKTTGDGALAEFTSAVDAVRCALDMQRSIAVRNADRPADKRAELRIGVNVDDIIADEGDIFGDAVNVAARIEGLADPGGVFVSGAVYDQVQGKIEAGFENIGPQSVKNISRPVQVLRVKPQAKPDSAAAMTAPVPGFQGRPAIAVLPLQNMSGDPEQDYFADGIAEDILTRLAMWRWCPIIARNSSFAYRGRNFDVRQIGRELGARYVLEGSVRKAGDQVRITGQLIEAETGHHVWAERYDRKLDDIFAVQDEITEAITAALESAVGKAEVQRAVLKPAANINAWDLFQRGMFHMYRFQKDDFAAARDWFTRATQADPHFGQPHAALSFITTIEIVFDWAADPAAAVIAAHNEARLAVSFDPMDAMAHNALAISCLFMRQYDIAAAEAQAAVDCNPSDAVSHYGVGIVALVSGDPKKAIGPIAKAIRLSPNDEFLPFWQVGLGASHYMLRDYENALQYVIHAVTRLPSANRFVAASLAQLGRFREAQATVQAFLAFNPGFDLAALRRAHPFRREEDFAHLAEGLRKAGWPG